MEKRRGDIESRPAPAPEATLHLLRAYHLNGDARARERLVEQFMPLVRSLASRHARHGEDYEDLVQVGSIGLINAIDRFDLDRGGDLAAFAAPTVSGEIKRHLRDRAGTIRLPRGVAELRARIAAARDELTPRLGRDPSVDELASEMAVDREEVALAMNAASSAAPRSLPADSDLAGALAEGIGAADDRLALAAAIERLDEHEQRIVYLRFLRELGQEEVARELGISQRQLSRRTQAALAKLRRGLEEAPDPSAAIRLPSQPDEPKMAAMGATSTPVGSQYLDRPYHIVIAREGERGDGGWNARVEELRGCEAHGATYEEAARNIRVAMERWISDALRERREVPPPRAPASHSGKLMLRMPQTLHAELARAAEREEVSLNQFITTSLASTVGWAADRDAPAEPAGEGRWTPVLVANLVVVGLAGLAAVALLVVALTNGL